MLIEISCDKFRVNPIPFKKGLNVILGDDNGSNSIGKTSLLLVIDFVFGGETLLNKKDIVKELGHHDYTFKFEFDDQVFTFRRGTLSPESVYVIDNNENDEQVKEIDEYRALLSKLYDLSTAYLTFRQVTGLYSRIWGKDNLSVDKPLHIVSAVSPKLCILNLIKLFNKYDPIERIESELEETKSVQTAFRGAYKNQIINKITANLYKENINSIEEISEEIQDIQKNLSRYMVNFSDILNRELLELKEQKDSLLESNLQLRSKLKRVKSNLSGNRFLKSKHFETLLDFFPEIDVDRLASVEGFHSDIVKLLRSELKFSEKNLTIQIDEVDLEITRIDQELSRALSTTNAPSAVVNRVVDLVRKRETSIDENTHYDTTKAIATEAKEKTQSLADGKGQVVKIIEAEINRKIGELVEDVLGPGSKSPMINLGVNNYEYQVHEDTGTGTAFNALILFDIAILRLTNLPVLIHDSPLFKNIENDSLGRLFSVYSESEKQTFIAIDEKEKYGEKAEVILAKNSVIKLDKNNLLYIADWRSQQTNI